ncbi:unnamed protein product [Gongylonema pulchrum]|uniref:ATRX n=1 Tax=Gongylonema pulchrum TaxID=637853 RepID=A0A183D7F1_9BILA|nr:unnamed protein product [Gongylonema pulchrum]
MTLSQRPNVLQEKTKKKERKRKKERRNAPGDTGEGRIEPTNTVSEETLEEGEIVTEKDISPRDMDKTLVSYETSESEGEAEECDVMEDFPQQQVRKNASSTNVSANEKEDEGPIPMGAASTEHHSSQVSNFLITVRDVLMATG